MTNRERLAKLICESMKEQGDSWSFSEIADHLIEEGNVIVPPCKVGDRVYLLRGGIIELCEVEGIYYTQRRNYVKIRPFHQTYVGNRSIYYTPSISSFGKTVFLTREEAEKALKEGAENG